MVSLIIPALNPPRMMNIIQSNSKNLCSLRNKHNSRITLITFLNPITISCTSRDLILTVLRRCYRFQAECSCGVAHELPKSEFSKGMTYNFTSLRNYSDDPMTRKAFLNLNNHVEPVYYKFQPCLTYLRTHHSVLSGFRGPILTGKLTGTPDSLSIILNLLFLLFPSMTNT